MLNQLFLIPKQCAFFFDFFVLHKGHWYLKWIKKMNKAQVALDSHNLCRVEDSLQETQKLKSKVRTEFKVFCLAISLHFERWYYYIGIWDESFFDSLHQTKVKGLQYYQELLLIKCWLSEIHGFNTLLWKPRMSVSEARSKIGIELLNEFQILLCLYCLFKRYLTSCFCCSKGNWEARFSSTWKFVSQGTKSKAHTDKAMYK